MCRSDFLRNVIFLVLQRLEEARESDMKEARAMNFAEEEWLKKAKVTSHRHTL